MTLEDTLTGILKRNTWMHLCNPGCPNGCDEGFKDVTDPDTLRIVETLRRVNDVLDQLLVVLTDGAQVDDRSTETDLQIAQKRGSSMDYATDIIMDLQDDLELMLEGK